MSDEEEYTDEEVEEEEVEESEPAAAEPAAAEPEPAEDEEVEVETEEPQESAPAAAAQNEGAEAVPKLRKVERPAKSEGEAGQELSEAEQAMLAAKQKHEEEEAARLAKYEENRKLEKIQVDEELAALKQRQLERKREWEAENREYEQARKADEERKRAEVEARKAKIEEAKAKREEEKVKRQQMMAGAFVGGGAGAKPGRNFTVVKKEGGAAAGAGSTGASKRKVKSAEEIAAEKSNYMSIVSRPVDVANLLPNDLKTKIKQLHAKLVRLESEKYDLQKRHERQDYDLKELAERESQKARNKALAMGVEIEQAESGLVRPPKINTASKFDRQVDRRSYKERYDQFESPFVKPNPSIARGTARPPIEWGRSKNEKMEELETIRKNLEPPKYVEQAPVEGARAPVTPIPLQLPASEFEETPSAAAPVEEAAPPPPEKPKRGVRA